MITEDRLATAVLLSEPKDANSKSKIIMTNTRLYAVHTYAATCDAKHFV